MYILHKILWITVKNKSRNNNKQSKNTNETALLLFFLFSFKCVRHFVNTSESIHNNSYALWCLLRHAKDEPITDGDLGSDFRAWGRSNTISNFLIQSHVLQWIRLRFLRARLDCSPRNFNLSCSHSTRSNQEWFINT